MSDKHSDYFYIKIAVNVFFIVLLFIICYLKIYNPFDPLNLKENLPPINEGLNSFDEIKSALKNINYLFVFITIAVLLCNIFVLLHFWKIKRRKEKLLFIIATYLLYYLISISPSIFSFRLWSSDSAYHLLIVNNFKKNLDYHPSNFQYGCFFYHKLCANISSFFNIDTHTLFLFFPQFLTTIIYFSGLYMLIFSKKNIVNSSNYRKKIMFIFVLFNPLTFYLWGSFKPFSFVLAFAPLVIHLTLHLFENLMNSLILICIMIIVLISHIFGFWYFLIIFQTILAKILFNIYKRKRKFYLIPVVSIGNFIFTLLCIIFPEIMFFFIKGLFYLFPFKNVVIQRFKDDFFVYGGKISSVYFQFFSLYSYLKFFMFFLFFGPVIYSILKNLYKTIRFYSVAEFENNSQLRILVNIFIPSTVLGYFFGSYDLSLYRLSFFTIFLYYIVFLVDIYPNCMLKFIKVKKILNINVKKINFTNFNISKKVKRDLLITILVLLLILPVFIDKKAFTATQYQAIKWIQDNTPENSTILTSTDKLNSLTEALSGRKSICYSWKIFDSNTSNIDEKKILSDFIKEFCNGSELYIFLYFDEGFTYKVFSYNNGIIDAYYIKNFISNSSSYSLIYYNQNSEIYHAII